MKNKLFYIITTAVTVLLCFSGCTESSSTESRFDKRALEDTETTTATAKSETTVTTFTPLQTFARFADMDKSDTEVSPTEAKKSENKKTTAVIEKDSTDWFENNKLFDMEMQLEETDKPATTRFRFWEEPTVTITSSVTQTTEAAVETQITMITRSPMEFCPGE